MNIECKTTEELMDKINKEEEKHFMDFLNKLGYTFSDVYNKNITIEIVYQKMNKYYIVFNQSKDILGGIGVIFDKDFITQNEENFTITYTIKTLTPEEIDSLNVKDCLAKTEKSSLYFLKKCKDILSITPKDVFEEHCEKCGLNDTDDESDSVYEEDDFQLLPDASDRDYYPVGSFTLKGSFSETLEFYEDVISRAKSTEDAIYIMKTPEEFFGDIIIVPKKYTKEISMMVEDVIKTMKYPLTYKEYTLKDIIKDESEKFTNMKSEDSKPNIKFNKRYGEF